MIEIPVQPVFTTKYFKKFASKLPTDVASQFYLSWEDGLWDIIRSFQIKRNSIILVPSFFCVDVMNNMKDHGLIPVYYEVDDNLQPVKDALLQSIKKNKAQMVVLFHAVGITNNLVTEKFIKSLPKDLFIIEDCVHRITNPSEIEIYSLRHVVMNSLRKVVPLQGSFIFGKRECIERLKGSEITFLYSWSVIVLWFLMQLSYLSQQYVHTHFGKLAQWFMLRGYDIIGDEQKAGYCPRFFADLYMKLDFDNIKLKKQLQVALYKENLRKKDSYYVPYIPTTDYDELRGYPVVVKKHTAELLVTKCRSVGLFIRKELDDSLWTEKRSIIYLPLGHHIENEDIKAISSLFNTLL